MTAPVTDAGAPGARGDGWVVLLSSLAAFLLVPGTPVVQRIVPIAQTAILLVPAIAVCTVLGWAAGGPWWLAAAWALLGVAAIVLLPDATSSAAFATLERGWAVMLVASFGLVSIASSFHTPLHVRALGGLALALALAVLVLLATHARLVGVTAVLARDLATRPKVALPVIYVADGDFRSHISRTYDAMVAQLPRVGARLFPSLLSLESLAALALAWRLHGRISAAQIGQPLGRWRDFRFSDRLVWPLAAGLMCSVLPGLGALRLVALNVTVLFGALYVVRWLGSVVAHIHLSRSGAG